MVPFWDRCTGYPFLTHSHMSGNSALLVGLNGFGALESRGVELAERPRLTLRSWNNTIAKDHTPQDPLVVACSLLPHVLFYEYSRMINMAFWENLCFLTRRFQGGRSVAQSLWPRVGLRTGQLVLNALAECCDLDQPRAGTCPLSCAGCSGTPPAVVETNAVGRVPMAVPFEVAGGVLIGSVS